MSHCWGRSPVIQTTSHLLDQYKQNIPFKSLSKTFQDGVIVCRRLRIRFLWIDSLCILQDDPQDWEQESTKMADVCAGSYLNISALAAPDGTGGCFYPRNRSIVLRCASARAGVNFIYISKKPTNYWTDISRSRLASRAWVLQERVLPFRSLVFGSDQLHWDCLESLKSESSFRNLENWSAVGRLRRYLVEDIQSERIENIQYPPRTHWSHSTPGTG